MTNRTPPHLSVILGNPGKRARPKVVPRKPIPALTRPPAPPAFLSAEGRAEFRRPAALLVARGVLTALDLSVLAAYADSVGTWQLASRLLAAEPSPIVASPSGIKRPHPLVKIARDARRDALRFASELGIAGDLSGHGDGSTPPAADDDPMGYFT
jgi:P27 family predicted phage terminase small subunit